MQRWFAKASTSGRPLKTSVSRSSLGSVTMATTMWTSGRHHAHLTGNRDKPITLTWVMPNGQDKKEIKCFEGQNLLDIALEHHLPMEGACAGSCACSTCHVMLEDNDLEKFPEAEDKELDMLDLAFMPTPNSRLGCQLVLGKEHDGMVVRLPKATRNMAVDGYVATPH